MQLNSCKLNMETLSLSFTCKEQGNLGRTLILQHQTLQLSRPSNLLQQFRKKNERANDAVLYLDHHTDGGSFYI